MRLPQNPFHPGEMWIEEFLIPGKMTQSALAKKLGWSRARLNRTDQGETRYHGRLRSGSAPCAWHIRAEKKDRLTSKCTPLE